MSASILRPPDADMLIAFSHGQSPEIPVQEPRFSPSFIRSGDKVSSSDTLSRTCVAWSEACLKFRRDSTCLS